jgi:alginate production protein
VLGFFFLVQADESEDILAEVQERYQKIEYLKVEFEQINKFKLSGIENRSSGIMYITRDDRFRLESEQQTIVTDGKKIWSYWLEAALARGEINNAQDIPVPQRGESLDVGVTLIAPVSMEPSLTLGYAFGSGDDDQTDGVDYTFHQSGMQLNNGKWNGVSNFRYYGELLRPELANLRVETYGFGLRPRRRTSIDLIYHRYRLDRAAGGLVNAAIDRNTNLLQTDLGSEWDVVIGIEDFRPFEFEIDFGYFQPGGAFPGNNDSATTTRLKMKYVF